MLTGAWSAAEMADHNEGLEVSTPRVERRIAGPEYFLGSQNTISSETKACNQGTQEVEEVKLQKSMEVM